MNTGKVAIIGGGISGLAAGSYLGRSGFRAELFEKNREPGGVAVAWRRGGYLFDGATNWLPGSAPPLSMHKVLSELIDFEKEHILPLEEFCRIESSGGAHLRVMSNADSFREEMLRCAPEDKKVIDDFTAAIKKAAGIRLPVEKTPDVLGIPGMIGVFVQNIPLMTMYLRRHGVTIAEYASRFRNPVLREMFLCIFPDHSHFSVLGLILSLGWMHAGCTGYPMGGSKRLIEGLTEKYAAAGGQLHCSTPVRKIVVEGDRVRGIETEGGKWCEADYVIATADGHHTLFDLLDNRYLSPKLKKAYDTLSVFPSLIQVSLGINRTFEGVSPSWVMPLEAPVRSGKSAVGRYMKVRICNFDPVFAPPGKTSVIAHLRTPDWSYWHNLRRTDPAGYAAEKARVADAVTGTLDKRFGEVSAAVEVTDTATPATWIRYTNVWRGSYQGWAPTPNVIGRTLPKTLPRVKGLYLAGQWSDPPGGIPQAINSGRRAAQIVCRETGKRFVSS